MTTPKKRGARGQGYFPKVREARQAIADNALAIYGAYMALAVAAQEAGEFITAEKIFWNLLSHMPEDEDTGKLLSQSVDAKGETQIGPVGPTIQIGLALGGMPTQSALPENVIVDTQPFKKTGPSKGTRKLLNE